MSAPEPRVVTFAGQVEVTRCQLEGHSWAVLATVAGVRVHQVCTRPGCTADRVVRDSP
ncbi:MULTISPECIES: hypothetical protein [unclassified Isoptericola]|uniref:hypothetical protein n=1 Tax=unclassified Isoptericola TaxID=2623355 RepID=UPI0036527D3D